MIQHGKPKELCFSQVLFYVKYIRFDGKNDTNYVLFYEIYYFCHSNLHIEVFGGYKNRKYGVLRSVKIKTGEKK